MAARNDLTIYKGESVTLPFRHVTEGTTSPIDITGWTLACTIKKVEGDTAAILTPTVSMVAPLTGDYAVVLTVAQTGGLEAGIYVYDVWRTDTGSEAPISYGTFTVLRSVRVR